MLKRLAKLLSPSPTEFDIQHVDENDLPVMTGDELIRVLNQTNRIRSIKRTLIIDDLRFEKMYLTPIYRFCEIVQLTPASQAHHHSFPGGLIVHTLSVIELALNERMNYTLPLSSDPQTIEDQKPLWTFAVFVAALCHDIGKTVTMVAFVDNDSLKVKNVLAGTMIEQGVKSYHFAWKPTQYYKLHQQIGASFLMKLLDDISLDFLSSELDVFKEVLAYIQADEYNWGSIGHIVQTADSESTAAALKIANGSRKFRGANLENFGERVMRTLRLILNNSGIAKNRAGAAIWVNEYYTYAVAKPFAEMIREEMQRQGATDVPSDNTRIFDELQHQSFCETSPDGQAIFKVEITLADGSFKQTFTCIKLRNQSLFKANKLPKPLQGQIVELSGQRTPEPVVTQMSQTEPVMAQTQKTEPVVNVTQPTEPVQVTQPVVTETPTAEPVGDDLFGDLLNQTLSPGMTTSATGSTQMPTTEPVVNETPTAETVRVETQTTETGKNEMQTPVVSETSTAEPVSDKTMVKHFFDWLYGEIETKVFLINRNSPVYVVEYNERKHLAIMSPLTFAKFAHHKGYVESIDQRSEMLDAAKIIQKSFHKANINIGIAGKQVHYYKKNNSPSAKTPKLSFYLVPIENINNPKLRELVEGTEYANSIERLFKGENGK